MEGGPAWRVGWPHCPHHVHYESSQRELGTTWFAYFCVIISWFMIRSALVARMAHVRSGILLHAPCWRIFPTTLTVSPNSSRSVINLSTWNAEALGEHIKLTEINDDPNLYCVYFSFSPCGLFLYSIQSPRRGKTFLIKWVIAKTVTSSKSSPGTALSAYPLEVVAASKVPSTRLAINESGSLLAVGASDGNVHIYHSATMKKVCDHLFGCGLWCYFVVRCMCR